jgi:Zn ribbon nucleic-acid-binding protein
MIELVAEDKKETELLRRVFQGEGPFRYRMHSFGYDRKMPRRKAAKEDKLQWWAERQVLVFILNPTPKIQPNGLPFAKCLKCGTEFHDTIHGRKAPIWCPHVTFEYQSGVYHLTKGKLEDVRFLNNPNFF